MTPTDPRHLVIDGRKWRRTDPSIPAALAAELVAELMDARRAVAAAKRGGDSDAEAAARARVHAAKVALGERGDPWWEEPTAEGRTRRIRAATEALLAHRNGGSICPSEVARVIGGGSWRSAMPSVREVVFAAAREGSLVIRQRGSDIDPAKLHELKGALRIARGPSPPPR